ncbi:hypothetical protein LguiB_019884 [Lonicera macranthoides]
MLLKNYLGDTTQLYTSYKMKQEHVLTGDNNANICGKTLTFSSKMSGFDPGSPLSSPPFFFNYYHPY